LYGKEEEVFLFLMEKEIQSEAIILTDGVLNQKELKYLKRKAVREITNLIIKIGSSGIEK